MKAAREFLQSHWPSILLILGVLLFISLVLGYVFGWEWVGVVEYTRFVNGELVEIQRQKTLWDWLDLLIIPAVLAVGAWWLNKTQREAEREEAEKNRKAERRIANNRREQETLDLYFDRMTELLLAEQLWERSRNEKGEPEPEVRTIARARTLSVVRNLGPRRTGYVVQFLYEAGLIEEHRPLIDLHGANLERADLVMAQLPGANLEGAYLKKADMLGANLEGATLNNTTLVQADLNGANLDGAHLFRAVLQKAYLSYTNLSNANLVDSYLAGAKLFSAKLEGADLKGANLNHAKFEEASYDKYTTWPEGFDPKAAGAILVDEEGNPVEDSG